MNVINDPSFREIARKIVMEPGFSTTGDGARRALGRLAELTSPVQRQGLADLLIIRWLFDEHAEWRRSLVQRPELPAPNVVAGTVEGGRLPEPELRFRSESPQWSHPETSPQASDDSAPKVMPPAGIQNVPGGHTSGGALLAAAAEGMISPQASRGPASILESPAGNQAALPATDTPVPVPGTPEGHETSRSQRMPGTQSIAAAADSIPGGHAVIDTHMRSAAGEQSPPPRPDVLPSGPVPIQQPSRKVAAYRQMFPELSYPHQAASGPKPLADFTGHDIGYLITQITAQRQAWRTRNAGDEERIGVRERLNARDRVRIAERRRNIADAVAQEERLRLAAHEIEQHDVATLGELPAEALDACGFKRRVA